MIVAVEGEETEIVLMGKDPVVAPAGTVTVAGTVTLVLLDFSAITAPAEPAEPVSVNVPVEGLPPITAFGETDSEAIPGGLIVRTAV